MLAPRGLREQARDEAWVLPLLLAPPPRQLYERCHASLFLSRKGICLSWQANPRILPVLQFSFFSAEDLKR